MFTSPHEGSEGIGGLCLVEGALPGRCIVSLAAPTACLRLVQSMHGRRFGSPQFGCRASRVEKSRFQGRYVFTESSMPPRSSANPGDRSTYYYRRMQWLDQPFRVRCCTYTRRGKLLLPGARSEILIHRSSSMADLRISMGFKGTQSQAHLPAASCMIPRSPAYFVRNAWA